MLPKPPGVSSDLFNPAPNTSLMAVKAAGRKVARLKAQWQRALQASGGLSALSAVDDAEPLPDALAAVGAAVRLTKRYKWNGPKPPRDPRSLAGLTEGEPWTAGHLRQALSVLAAGVGAQADWLAAETLRRQRRRAGLLAADWEDARAHFAGLVERAQTASARRAAATLLPRADRGDLMIRYESHLQKLLTTTLHELERLQALRAGRAVVPPVVVDMTVTGLAIEATG